MNQSERIDKETLHLPTEISAWIGNAAVYENSGHSGVQTVYIKRDNGAYLKIAGRGVLHRSAVMQDFYYHCKLSSPVIQYLSADRDYLITAPVKGNDGTSEKYIADPERLSEVFAHALRFLHDISIKDCPFADKMPDLLKMAETVMFRQSHLDGISKYIGATDAKKAADEITLTRRLIKSDVIIHGDYCLPNIIFNDGWSLSGFIDLGDSGMGDRHYDLAMGLWTLNKNLKTQKYGQRFLDVYGWSDIDKNRLRICGLLVSME